MKKIIMRVVVASICGVILYLSIRTIFPISVYVSELSRCNDSDGEYTTLLNLVYGWGNSDDPDLDKSRFPSEKEEDYLRLMVSFAADTYGILPLNNALVSVNEESNSFDRLVYHTDGSNIDGSISKDFPCNMTFFFFVGGLSEEEIHEYVNNTLSSLEFTYVYDQKYIGLREKRFSIDRSCLDKMEWRVVDF